MISVEGLAVEFSAKPLFSNASFVINSRDRIALVGKNGAGKSTLLKLLCGMQKPSRGNISFPNDITVGYLPQVMNLQDDTTVRQETRNIRPRRPSALSTPSVRRLQPPSRAQLPILTSRSPFPGG